MVGRRAVWLGVLLGDHWGRWWDATSAGHWVDELGARSVAAWAETTEQTWGVGWAEALAEALAATLAPVTVWTTADQMAGESETRSAAS